MTTDHLLFLSLFFGVFFCLPFWIDSQAVHCSILSLRCPPVSADGEGERDERCLLSWRALPASRLQPWLPGGLANPNRAAVWLTAQLSPLLPAPGEHSVSAGACGSIKDHLQNSAPQSWSFKSDPQRLGAWKRRALGCAWSSWGGAVSRAGLTRRLTRGHCLSLWSHIRTWGFQPMLGKSV